MSVAAPDRRAVRRQATLDELVEVALDVMAEHGAAGLSLGEVARRMGMRPPSLYGYVESKNAVYDLVFEQGWRAVLDMMRELPEPGTDALSYLEHSAEAYVRWSIEHPVHAQLMGWRQVPNYAPSAQAYAPAVVVLGEMRSLLVRLQGNGALRADADVDEALKAWTVLISGVISQQLANDPGTPFEQGAFTTLLPALVRMYVAHYGTSRRTSRSKEKP